MLQSLMLYTNFVNYWSIHKNHSVGYHSFASVIFVRLHLLSKVIVHPLHFSHRSSPPQYGHSSKCSPYNSLIEVPKIRNTLPSLMQSAKTTTIPKQASTSWNKFTPLTKPPTSSIPLMSSPISWQHLNVPFSVHVTFMLMSSTRKSYTGCLENNVSTLPSQLSHSICWFHFRHLLQRWHHQGEWWDCSRPSPRITRLSLIHQPQWCPQPRTTT